MKAAIKKMTRLMKSLSEEKQRHVINFAEYIQFQEMAKYCKFQDK